MLRDYQQDIKHRILASPGRHRLAVLPTGGGKTVVAADIIREHSGPCCMIAHRQEIVSQIALAMAREQVRHRVIGPSKVIKQIVALQMTELGKSYFDPSAPCAVAGVDTLIRRGDKLKVWLESVTLWIMDEAHHVTQGNKWGKAVAMFSHARGLGLTATPMRTDGKGLGDHADGVFHDLIVGPCGRDLITRGHLSDYRIYAPLSDIDVSSLTVGATGDFSAPGLAQAAQRSHIVGDVVEHYLRIAPGLRGVTFATDVKTAGDIADQYNARGVPAAVVHAKTPDMERVAAVRRLRSGDLLQLVNVDIFGEGFDLPAVSVVSMARPTCSFGLFAQQFGRALRIAPDKPHAIIIDHVGNTLRHGLPDAPRSWSLDRREKRNSEPGGLRLKACPMCTGVYSRLLLECPYCGHVPVPVERSGPEFVDGDLTELDAATLARLRGDVEQVDKPVEDYRAELAARHCPAIGQMAHVKRHAARQEAQGRLRETMAWWAGFQRHAGRSDRESYRKFYLDFGIDVLSAQALGRAEAEALEGRVNESIVQLTKERTT